jgi:hypothetical protein
MVILPCAASCVKADAIVLGYVEFLEMMLRVLKRM